ncbi:MAG: hypothetical protein LCH37_14410 [Bacteroidetes bacterium]|nr:hypothetical protein [Bacteroidota bacterium]
MKKNRKIIFLDHDGVLALGNQFPTNHNELMECDAFASEAVRVLNEVLDETNAEIVISSDWRLIYDLVELQFHYQLNNVKQEPKELTPDLSTIFPDKSPAFIRTAEIMMWLKNRTGITSWVAIDDLPLHLERFVQTDSNWGIIQPGIKEQIIHFLTQKL